MSDLNTPPIPNQPEQTQYVEENKKEERIDELDVIGAFVMRFIEKILNTIKNRKN